MKDKHIARELKWGKHLVEPICTNCGRRGKHFVPPCFGEPGFFACAEFIKESKPNESPN